MADEAEGTEQRPSPAEVNARRNAERLTRMNEIAQGVDGKRARQMVDVEGEEVVGPFAGGELDDSPEAREAQAAREEAEAAQALADAEAAAEGQPEESDEARAAALARADAATRGEARRAAEGEARALQEEGAEEGAAPSGEGAAETPAEGDEKTVGGVKYYLTAVGGQLKWLTLKDLRETAGKVADADQTLQAARDALQRASTAALSPKDEPVELGEAELESVVLSAVMGDGEAVKKLVSVIRARTPGATPADVQRQVSQQMATERAVRAAEDAQAELTSNEVLAPVFRQRLSAFATEFPKTKIADAYKTVGDQMRKDFAPMLARRPGAAPSKDVRKRSIVSPPAGAGRQPTRDAGEQEETVASVIDRMAKGRGQARAIRQGGT